MCTAGYDGIVDFGSRRDEKDMTIEEVKRIAKAGNIEAIHVVADYCYREGDIMEAAEWYERSAEHGNSAGRIAAFQMRCLGGITFQGTGYFMEALECWSGAYRLLSGIVNDDGIDEESQQLCLKKLPSIEYGIGAIFYLLGRRETASDSLHSAVNGGSVIAKIALGLMYYDDIADRSRPSDIHETISLLEAVFDPDLVIGGIGSKLDETIIYRAHCLLAEIYRKGTGGLEQDVGKAYNCMLHLQAQSLENYSEEAEVELRKYGIGFGEGYQYSE